MAHFEGFAPTITITSPVSLFSEIVEKGAKVSSGEIVESVGIAWRPILDFLAANPQGAFQFDWRQWEEILAAAYKAHGFDEVVLTPRSGDGGKDVVATKHGRFSIRVYDQMKRNSPGNLVTHTEVLAMKGLLDEATKCIVTTTSDFEPGVWTAHAIESQLRLHKMELVNGPNLLRWLGELRDAD